METELSWIGWIEDAPRYAIDKSGFLKQVGPPINSIEATINPNWVHLMLGEVILKRWSPSKDNPNVLIERIVRAPLDPAGIFENPTLCRSKQG